MATDYFLKIPTVDGESIDDKHKGEIEVESFSWGVTNAGTFGQAGGGGAGKASAQDIHFTKKVDKSSPALFLACALGTHLKDVVLTVRKAGGGQQDYYTVKIPEAFVSTYQAGAAQGSELPTDQFSLNFSKFQFIYKEQKPDGTLGAAVDKGYDFSANKKL